MWDLILDQIKHWGSLAKFKISIKYWSPNDRPCQLRKTYIAQVGLFDQT